MTLNFPENLLHTLRPTFINSKNYLWEKFQNIRPAFVTDLKKFIQLYCCCGPCKRKISIDNIESTTTTTTATITRTINEKQFVVNNNDMLLEFEEEKQTLNTPVLSLDTINEITKSSQSINGNVHAERLHRETDPPLGDADRVPQKTPTDSIKSSSYSQKSTASAQSSNRSRSLNEEPERNRTTAAGHVKSANTNEDGEPVILTTPITTIEGTLNGDSEGKEVTSESPSNWRTGEDILQVEDIVDVATAAPLQEVMEIKELALERNGSLASLQSKAESIKTQMEDTPPVLSRAQSDKSLVIDEEIEDNASFVLVEDVEDTRSEEEEEDQKSKQLEETTEDSEGPTAIPASMPNSAAASRPGTSRSKSPTIEEIKALSRRNSMIASMEFMYEKSPPKHEFNDNATETSSQSSAQLNSSSTSTIINPIQLKPQHTPLKQKSKTTHILKSHRRVSPVKQSIKMVQAELYPPTLQRFEKPREALMKTFDQLDSSNWEVVMVGLQHMVRLMRYHPDNLDTQMHMVCVQLARSVRNLRSQVARAACQAATELFTLKTRFLEQECDELVCALLHRSADTNRFIRADSTRAVESMCDNLSPAKVLSILTTKGALHQNALVRTTTAKMLNRLVERLGCEKIYTLPRDQRDKFFVTGANLLLEGSLDTRSYAKSLFRLLSDHANYHRLLREIIPQRTFRNVEKTLKSIR